MIWHWYSIMYISEDFLFCFMHVLIKTSLEFSINRKLLVDKLSSVTESGFTRSEVTCCCRWRFLIQLKSRYKKKIIFQSSWTQKYLIVQTRFTMTKTWLYQVCGKLLYLSKLKLTTITPLVVLCVASVFVMSGTILHQVPFIKQLMMSYVVNSNVGVYNIFPQTWWSHIICHGENCLH